MAEDQNLENLGSVEVPLSVGQTWTAKYRKAPGIDEDGKNKITAYLIPLAALQGVLANPIDAVRAYKGINAAGEQCLIFVGTQLDEKTGIYKDVFFPANEVENAAKAEKVVEATETAEDVVVVYDTSRPCPPYGDPSSPLA
jgi:hypothetical protein